MTPSERSAKSSEMRSKSQTDSVDGGSTNHAGQLWREQRRAALLMEIMQEQRALLDVRQPADSAMLAHQNLADSRTVAGADTRAAAADASIGQHVQQELAADWLSLRRSLDQLAAGLPAQPTSGAAPQCSPATEPVHERRGRQRQEIYLQGRSPGAAVDAADGNAANMAVQVAGLQAALEAKEAELMELEAAGQTWLDDAQQLRMALDSTLTALSATKAEKQALRAALEARSEQHCRQDGRQGNEARSLASVPCPHPRAQGAAASYRPSLPPMSLQQQENTGTQTPEVRSTQTPGRCSMPALPPAHLDFRGDPPVAIQLPLPALQLQPRAGSDAGDGSIGDGSVGVPQSATRQQQRHAADAGGCGSEARGRACSVGACCAWDGSSSDALHLQQTETISADSSPKFSPYRLTSSAQSRHHASHSGGQQQVEQQDPQCSCSDHLAVRPDSSSIARDSGSGPTHSSHGARGGGTARGRGNGSARDSSHGSGDVAAQNRRLRAAVAEANAQRDEALSQSRSLRAELGELQQQTNYRSELQVDKLQQEADAAPELGQRLKAAEEAADGLRSQLQAAQQAAAEAEQRHAAELATAQSEAQTALQQRAGIGDMLTAAQDRLQQVQRDLEAQHKATRQAQAETQDLRGRLEAAAADLAAARAACVQAEHQAAAAEQRAKRAEAAAADAHFAAAKAKNDAVLTPHSTAALASQAAQLRNALEGAIVRAEEAERRARAWESRWEAERAEAEHAAAKADAAEERAAHWARCAGLADVDSPIAGLLSPSVRTVRSGSRSRSRTAGGVPSAPAGSESPEAMQYLQRTASEYAAERTEPTEDAHPPAAQHAAGPLATQRPPISQRLPKLWQDSAARFVQQLPPAAPVGSGLRPSCGIGRFSTSDSGGGISSARLDAGSNRSDGSCGLQTASTLASHATAAAPVTPAAALAASVAAAAAVAQHLAAHGPGSGRPRQSTDAAHGEAAAAARDAADMAACRREVLQHSPQRTLQPTGSPPQGGMGSKCGDRRPSVRIKRRHADAAATSASSPGTLPAAVGSSARSCAAKSLNAAARMGISSSGSSPQSAATHGARSSPQQDSSPTATPDAAAARHWKGQQGQHSLHDLPARDSHSSLQQMRHSPSREHRHSGSPARMPAGWKHSGGPAVEVRPESGSLLPQKMRPQMPLQPLQTPTKAAWQTRHGPTESKHDGSGSGSRRRSRISVDATATATARVLQVAGRLRAASADRKGGGERRRRSPSVEEDLDEVTAILNQLRHR